MKCLHCGVSIHERWERSFVGDQFADGEHGNSKWVAQHCTCPDCGKSIIELCKVIAAQQHISYLINNSTERFFAYPQTAFRNPVSKHVPNDIRSDFQEAAAVLQLSPKASAALSRRCLQAVLKTQGYLQKALSTQIDAVLNEVDPQRAIGPSLRAAIDGIRNYGNFSAHPMNDITTLQVIDVDPGEAEWCLETLEEMFDNYYVRPAEIAARKDALNAKLALAGKPPSK